jgi:hypothetical protein
MRGSGLLERMAYQGEDTKRRGRCHDVQRLNLLISQSLNLSISPNLSLHQPTTYYSQQTRIILCRRL